MLASGRCRPAHVIAHRPYAELAAALDVARRAECAALVRYRAACKIEDPIGRDRAVRLATSAHAAAETARRVAEQAVEDGGHVVS